MRSDPSGNAEAPGQPRARGLKFWALTGLILATVGSIFVRSFRDPRSTYWNFAYLYTGSECLVDGCDPYNADQLNREVSVRAENVKSVFDPQYLVYPPSSLVVLVPFAGLRWPESVVVFNGVSALTMASACLLALIRLRLEDHAAACAVLLATLMSEPMRKGIVVANPALLCVSLSVIVVLLALDRSRPATATAAWGMLACALGLKPQLAIGPAVFLLLHDETRSVAWKAWIGFAAIMFAGVLSYRLRMGSFDYLEHFAADVRLSLLPGHLSDSSTRNPTSYDFLNLQVLVLRMAPVDVEWANRIAEALTAMFAGLAGWFWWSKGTARNRPWTMLALLVLISLLPVYHRGYDRLVAILLLPAIVEVTDHTRAEGWAIAALTVFWLTSDMFLRRWVSVPVRPAAELLLCGMLLASLRSRTASNTAVAARDFVATC